MRRLSTTAGRAATRSRNRPSSGKSASEIPAASHPFKIANNEAGGFSQAARLLGVTTAATSKAVIAPERRLGVRLFERTTRRVQPTEAGDALYRRIKPALAELRAAEDTVSAARASPSGRVRLDVPVTFGHFRLPSLIAEFRALHPDIELVATSSDRYTDLISRSCSVVGRRRDRRSPSCTRPRGICPRGSAR